MSKAIYVCTPDILHTGCTVNIRSMADYTTLYTATSDNGVTMSISFETVACLVQKYLFVPSQVRDVYLVYLLRVVFSKTPSIIIFTGKCKTAELLRIMFYECGIKSATLHSKMPQRERMASLAKFKSQMISCLVTTDVASRGLDISTVQLVINFDLPADPRDYIHRIGRTARAGRGGLALSFVGEIDISLVHAIEGKIRRKLDPYEEKNVPEDEVLLLLNEVSKAKRVATMKLLDSSFGLRDKLNKEKAERSQV